MGDRRRSSSEVSRPFNLRKYRLKLNPDKCTFGVPAGKLLGFLVSSRGIEVNPAKIKAIERMKLPTCLKDVQKFTGCLASLSRFVSRLGEKALPLYKVVIRKIEKIIGVIIEKSRDILFDGGRDSNQGRDPSFY